MGLRPYHRPSRFGAPFPSHRRGFPLPCRGKRGFRAPLATTEQMRRGKGKTVARYSHGSLARGLRGRAGAGGIENMSTKKRVILGICSLGLLAAFIGGCHGEAHLGTVEPKAATPPPPPPPEPPPPPPPRRRSPRRLSPRRLSAASRSRTERSRSPSRSSSTRTRPSSRRSRSVSSTRSRRPSRTTTRSRRSRSKATPAPKATPART